MFKRLREDVQAVRDRDPAARHAIEILLLYPGVLAVRRHRRANWFWRHNMPFFARAISQRVVRKTGIEIHPGATLGRRLFIDHGCGVVIGETCEIGDDVTIYQGVTLGGTGKDIGKRHPTIGHGVLIGAGAKVLGPFKVGDNSKIAAGAIVMREVPPNSTAAGGLAHVVKQDGNRVDHHDHTNVPDVIAQEICQLRRRVALLEAELQAKE